MKIIDLILDFIGYSKKTGDLITENGKCVSRYHNGENYHTTIETESGVLLESTESNEYYVFREKDQILVKYWNKVNSKGEIIDYEVFSMQKLHL